MHPNEYQRYNLHKTAYTVRDLIDSGVVGCRTSLYGFVRQGRLKITKQGKRTIFLLPDVASFLASLEHAKGGGQ